MTYTTAEPLVKTRFKGISNAIFAQLSFPQNIPYLAAGNALNRSKRRLANTVPPNQ